MGGAPPSEPPPPGVHHFEVAEGDAGDRLDLWIASASGLSRTRVQRLLADGKVSIDGRHPRKSEVVDEGWVVEVEVPEIQRVQAEPEDLPITIMYEDDDLLVVDKASGMVVHPAPGHPRGTLVNALLHHASDLSGIGGHLRPGIVHRLDKDTSGLMVVAKRDLAHRRLSDALRAREVNRVYLAASWGHLKESSVTIDRPLGRDPKDRKRMAVRPDGRHAVTHVKQLESWMGAELLEVTLETGRTHQIRVHLASLGHPVVGDDAYGAGWERGLGGPQRGWARELARRTTRQFLHATSLSFRHPSSGEEMAFSADLPPDLQEIATWARG